MSVLSVEGKFARAGAGVGRWVSKSRLSFAVSVPMPEVSYETSRHRAYVCRLFVFVRLVIGRQAAREERSGGCGHFLADHI